MRESCRLAVPFGCASVIVASKNFFTDFSRQHDDDKVIDILRKTWAKMSDKGHAAAQLAFDEATKLNITGQIARKMQASELATKTLEVLVRHHRINDIDAIIEALAAYVNKALGIAVAEVRSAKALTPDEIRDLADTLSKKVGKKVELDIRTDPKLLGGFVVRIGSEIWDASVIGKINKFRESLA